MAMPELIQSTGNDKDISCYPQKDELNNLLSLPSLSPHKGLLKTVTYINCPSFFHQNVNQNQSSFSQTLVYCSPQVLFLNLATSTKPQQPVVIKCGKGRYHYHYHYHLSHLALHRFCCHVEMSFLTTT